MRRAGRAEVAQLVEHATENRGVVSSILSLGTLGLIANKAEKCGRSTAVVRLLAKEKVVGSNPIARSSFGKRLAGMVPSEPLAASQMFSPRRRRQVARQGSAKPSSWVQIPSSPLS